MQDAYIVQSVRTPGCRRNKGAFKDTRPEDLLSFILKSAIDKTPNLEMKDVEDIMIGCAFPEAEQGLHRENCFPDCGLSRASFRCNCEQVLRLRP